MKKSSCPSAIKVKMALYLDAASATGMSILSLHLLKMEQSPSAICARELQMSPSSINRNLMNSAKEETKRVGLSLNMVHMSSLYLLCT